MFDEHHRRVLPVPAPGSAHGVVAPVRTDPSGKRGPTRRQASGPEWRRSSHGLYVPAYVELTPEQRVVEAGVLAPRGGLVTGWGALRWRGASWFSGRTESGERRPVHLTGYFHRVRPRPGVSWCGERVDAREWSTEDGVVVASAVRAVAFEMRYAASLTVAVQALDMAAHADLVSVAEATTWAVAHPGRVGIEQCRRACALADENAWSPMEVAMRLRWSDHRRPAAALQTNHPVFDLLGRHQLTPDLLDPDAGVAGEYEGTVHLTSASRHQDVDREALYRQLELELVVMTAPDLRKPAAFLRRLDAAYDRAARRSPSDRAWTTDLPAWWVRTDTVARRRALTEAQRRTWLRRGAA